MPVPDQNALIAWIDRENAQRKSPVTRRDIARAFGVKGPERTELREMLKRLEDEGAIALDGKRAKRPGQLPPVTVLTIEAMDDEGDLICTLPKEDSDARVLLPADEAAKSRPALGVGDRFLGKLFESGGMVRASVLKPLPKPQSRTLGVFRTTKAGGLVEPVSRKNRTTYDVTRAESLGAADGDLVWAEPKPQRGYGPGKARITEVIGSVEETRNLSLIALAEHDIPMDFPPAVLREVEGMTIAPHKCHEDITALPLVTIDPATARDHDDAVHAEKLEGGGFRLTVAIADVSWFVRPGSALDEEAEKRGNSVYLPDRVVPMLPEKISNDLCSLKEGKERLALCCEIEINPKGAKKRHRFFRARIRNHRNLAYEEAQAIEDGLKDGPPEVKVLFEAYRALKEERARRKPLDLDLPERRITMEGGVVTGIEQKDRMDAHRLIEEYMVLANVCAAETLTEKGLTAIYRVHDSPDPERLESLRQYLEPLGYTLPKADDIRAFNLNGVLEKAKERGELDIIAMSVLRSQRQALYDIDNIGHFGLSLKRYAHFTSPIRRYADLTVHRGLVRALGLGPGGERDEDSFRLGKISDDISQRERAAVSAERDTAARLLATYLEEQVGAVFEARIGGVTRVGLFVTLNETGADGFVPVRTLGWEYFDHDETRNALVGSKSGGAYSLGMPVKVRLLEATPLQGGLRFEMLTKPGKPGERRKEAAARPKGRAGGKAGAKAAPKADKPKEKAKTESASGTSTRHQKAKRGAARARGKGGNGGQAEEQKPKAPASKGRPAAKSAPSRKADTGSKPRKPTRPDRSPGRDDSTGAPGALKRRPRTKR